HSGRVRRIWLEDEIICASVMGSGHDYTTKVWCTDDGLEWRCSCPYDGWCCKHVVAVLYEFIKQKEELFNDLKGENQKIISIGNRLNNLSKEDLVEIILRVIRKNRNTKISLLEMLEEYLGDNVDEIYIQKYEEYWGEIEPVLYEFNELGGGPEGEEYIVYDNLEKIISLFKEDKLPQDTKIDFIDNLFHYYDWNNSGFEDSLMEAVFDVASSKSDWQYVIDKLMREETDWRKKLAMGIYRDHLHDDKNYLKMRMVRLKYGMDYYDLSQFWYRKGDIKRAVKIAEDGLRGGEGRVIDLIEFLFKHYKEKKDYKSALKYATCKFNDDPRYTRYEELKRFCKKKDWPKIESKCLEKLREYDRGEELTQIHLDKKEYGKVLEYVLDTSYTGYFDDREEFADKLKNIYPKEILKFYKERTQQSINGKDRKSYGEAAGYARKVKHIYTYILKDAEGWRGYIHSIRNKYQKYPALQEEFSEL
ncbi:MAG: SWIM zinc finger family protein, partial [Candidatus Altiarchaeota archaeon]|nr:SWIM zinc finger family protein [Candidatus Altiarchaeota archaeon]